VDTLRWQGLAQSKLTRKAWAAIQQQYIAMIDELKRFADACFYLTDREALFLRTREHRLTLHGQLQAAFEDVPAFATELGLEPSASFEVHELRRSMRVGPDGRHVPQVVVALTQSRPVPADEKRGTPAYTFRGGSTLLVDLSIPEVKYRILKRISSDNRQERTAAFIRDSTADPLRALFFAPNRREPFAALHALADDGL
jgi:hypothetical protein